MGFTCFPVTVSMPKDNAYADQRQSMEVALIVELADNVFEFAKKFAQKAAAAQAKRAVAAQVEAAANQAAQAAWTEQERAALAASVATPEVVLAQLATDPSSVVRTELVFNPATPQNLLQFLAADADKFIAGQARAKLSMAAAA